MKLIRFTDNSLDGVIEKANEFMKGKTVIDTQVIADSYNYSVVVLYENEEKKALEKKEIKQPTTPSKKK